MRVAPLSIPATSNQSKIYGDCPPVADAVILPLVVQFLFCTTTFPTIVQGEVLQESIIKISRSVSIHKLTESKTMTL